jgi:hypothetical protein
MLVHMRSSITDHHPQRVATRRNTRWGAILVVMAALVTAFAVAAQAGPPVVSPPTGPRPTTLALPPTYVGPTADITAVANAISTSHKSLEIVVTVKPGLVLTNSVTISIWFMNSAAVPKVITQCYVPSTGNRFVFHDIEWNGQPRRVGMQATLSQDKFRLGDAAGPSFPMPWYVDLDPLYDVKISHLGFFLRDDCACYGDSQIHFEWFSPDDQKHEYSFPTSKGKNTFIEQFAWARTEVSASARLHYPVYSFWTDWSICHPSGAYIEGGGPGSFPLVPGVSSEHIEILKEWHYQSCSAPIDYTTTYHLSKYAEDSPGGGGCFPSAVAPPANVPPPGGVKPPPVGTVKPPAAK